MISKAKEAATGFTQAQLKWGMKLGEKIMSNLEERGYPDKLKFKDDDEWGLFKDTPYGQ